MLRIEVALEVDGGASARGHHAMEEAQMRSTLHAALRPVQLARHLSLLIARIVQQGLVQLRAWAANALRVGDGEAKLHGGIADGSARACVRGNGAEPPLAIGLHALGEQAPERARGEVERVAARAAAGRAKRLDLGRREIEAGSRRGVEEARRLVAVAGAECG